LSAVGGIKIEHNDYTGIEYQPTARLRWTPAPRHTLWSAVSRAVRMPTRIDSDLRFTAGTPIVVLSGNADFQSETVLARELGYRAQPLPRLAGSISVFVNTYDRLRSQEPTLPLGVPITVGNKHHGRVAGVELGMQIEPTTWWHLNFNYSHLAERFGFDADSLDTTGGALEHNDPPHQFRFRSSAELPGRWSVDATYRWVDALPRPVVPAYGALTLRIARPVGRGVEVEVVGENLLDEHHLEFVNLGPPHVVPRSAFVRVSWRSR
jgi:iron complex outermembrane receptor protein